MSIADNIAVLRDRIATTARPAGREPEEITLMAVSKIFPASAILEAYAAGVRVFGENRVQEFAGKHAVVGALADAAFHLIGHLQSNKAGRAAEMFSAVDSVDSLKLAEKLNDAAARLGRRLEVLLEINVGGEAAKSGLTPDAPEIDAILEAATRLQHLTIRGLMAVPPFTADPEDARPYFRSLREIRDRIAAQKPPGVRMDVLSMGMSHDFEVAIQEG